MPTKKQYHGINEIDYWDKLSEEEKSYLKQFLVDEYDVTYKGMKLNKKTKEVYNRDNARRRDMWCKLMQSCTNFDSMTPSKKDNIFNMLIDEGCFRDYFLKMSNMKKYQVTEILNEMRGIIKASHNLSYESIKADILRYLKRRFKDG